MVRGILWSLWLLACATHGAKEVVLEPVFEKSPNGVFAEDNEVHFGFSLKNQTKEQLDLEVVWVVATDKKNQLPNPVLFGSKYLRPKKGSLDSLQKFAGLGFTREPLPVHGRADGSGRPFRSGMPPRIYCPP